MSGNGQIIRSKNQINNLPKTIDIIENKSTHESVNLRWKKNPNLVKKVMEPDFGKIWLMDYSILALDPIDEDLIFYEKAPFTGNVIYRTVDKKIERICNFKDGYKDGRQLIFKNDSITSEENFKYGRKFGVQRGYYDNRKISFYGNLVNGNGKIIYLDQNGKIESEEIYKDGLLNGVYKEYFESKIISEINYKDGLYNGYLNYRGRIFCNYSNGRLNGNLKASDSDNLFEVKFSNDTLKLIKKRHKYFTETEPETYKKYRVEQDFGKNKGNFLLGIENTYCFYRNYYTHGFGYMQELRIDSVNYLKSQGKIIRSSLNFTEDEIVNYIQTLGMDGNYASILEEVKKNWPDYVFCTISKDSIWKTWYFNGQLESTGSYTDNLQNGVWKTWFDNGVSKTEGSYRLTIKESNWKSWHSNGQLDSIGNYISEQKNGSWKFYNSKGQIISDENYSNGKKNGLFTKYYENGNLSSKENYINDIKHGIWKKYDENGIVTLEESYINGLKDGIWITRHSNGIKSSEVTYKDNKIIGERKKFDEKGNLIKPQPQVVVNNNVNQNNPNQSFQRQRENCITCNGSGKCNGCNKYFNCRYYNANASEGFRIQNRQETKPGYVMCTNCEGSSYSWQWPNNNAEHNIPCHVGRCINGWIECSKCSTSNRGACTECNGRGYQE